jgi:hypothetical protein
MMDFSLQVYETLLNEIRRSGLDVFPLKDFFDRRPLPPAFVLLRHDVDRRPERALRMAEVETSHGVRATYYFRWLPRVFKPGIVKSIASMGHEIGYHYEALDKASGDPRLAVRIFTRELAEMRAVVEVKTASMHGNPLSRRDNRDLWKHCEPAAFGLVGEAYLGISDPAMAYVTDTGRGWNRLSLNLRDRLPEGSVGLMPCFQNTWELIRALREGRCGRLYLQIHPNRWTSGPVEWAVQWGEDLLMNGVKRLVLWTGSRRPGK